MQHVMSCKRENTSEGCLFTQSHVIGRVTSSKTYVILKKVSHRSWAAPVVPVPKKNGKVRICVDYKVTVNPHLDVDQHPLPRPEELFATLANGKAFTKTDLS